MELKPCAHCGSTSITYDNCDSGSGHWWICDDCGATVKVRYMESAIEAWNRRAPIELPEADSSDVISDAEIAESFNGTNFGTNAHRELLHVAILKKACGYHCGHTITMIMKEMGLINADGKVLKRGQKLMRKAYHNVMIGGA